MAKANFMNSIQVKKNPVNVFDLTHDHKTSFNMGELIPIMIQEALPGDKWRISAESLVRFQPMVSPVMHRFDATIHYFFVPNRILWPNWEAFITNTKLEATGELPVFPYVDIDAAGYKRLHDYFGIPEPLGANVERVNALPFFAYMKAWADYYRDENNIQNMTPEVLKLITQAKDGDNNGAPFENFEIRKRAWEHDYFTSCLPFAQKGDEVLIPMTGVVELDDASTNTPLLKRTSDGMGEFPNDLGGNATMELINLNTNAEIQIDPNETLIVNNAQTTINDLREATKLQEWLEKMARAGTRLTEVLQGFFNVKPQDGRLQRAEYITGVKTPITVSEVLNTTGTIDAPQGAMAGHAVSVIGGEGGSYYCHEHGFIIGIMSVMPKTAYQQGLERLWDKITSPMQYFWPQFANLGEQAVKRKEVYAYQGANGELEFGYLPRYAEHRTAFNRVSGDFRGSLNHWHAGRIFATPPLLNEQFIEADPTHRIFAVTDPNEQKVLVHVLNKCIVTRQIPKFGTPQF